MNLSREVLRAVVTAIFSRAGCNDDEAAAIGRHLVEANLVGHDSHGVIRVPYYVQWMKDGTMVPNRTITVAFENDSIAIVDGNSGFGQILGEQAVDLGIAKCQRSGVAVVGLRNAGHLGRIGDWAIRAAEAGLVSIHFVNTSGGGILVAPFGGSDRRLSANPIAAGIPMPGGPPMIVDMSTCVIAEGKIKVARNKGVPVPENALIDGHGQATTSADAFYDDPPGAILTIAAHKGYCLSMLCEVLAGGLTGGGASNPDNPTADRVANAMMSIYLDPDTIAGEAFGGDVSRLIDWVRASPPLAADGKILLPGEIENLTKAERLASGVPLDDLTWNQMLEAAEKVGLGKDAVAAIVAEGA
ncbi:MAG: malate/lactate/ureidoglycolate dehydrogenase [Alphaproteobacteria bacterium]|jgi:uncharacterized oxidoreductase|nr:malate/lactate/ureidoglycolate dehydrogenase [Alphaproteobacteria bacterium]MDP6518132.1 malate/lactate/ureidoglycolate dehydrogenase [Alphaproteobacteria bacterium]